MKKYIKISLYSMVLILSAASQTSCAEDLILIKPEVPNKYGATAIKSAESVKLTNVRIFENQIFSLQLDKQQIGTLVSGRGIENSDGRENSTCFIVFLKSTGQSEFLKTVGQGDWEAEACIDVKSIGVIHSKKFTSPAIAIVYEAASPNTTVLEPVVFRFNDKGFNIRIDETDTKKASLAGATTLKDIRTLLQ